MNCSRLILVFKWLLIAQINAIAAVYTVSTKTDLQNRMSAALPGDTIIVVNGTYNFSQINFTNNNGSSSAAWIVLRPQTFNGVTFTGNTYLQFSGRRIHITGFRFALGNSGSNDVVQFRNAAGSAASFCRLSNITFDNYNSDSTGSVNGVGADVDNKWVSIYGTNNRVDHCTFINKSNAGATVTVWYNNSNYPQESTSTYHTIDSNYFRGRGYLGENGGETIRLGTSTTSRTNGFNTVAYNLFEDCIQTEPEIISNKSDFNTYCYNTFKNCNGGLTLRHGRYCAVFSNFFIVDNTARTRSYGVRVIDKGHKVYNNYFEGLRGNSNSLTSLRCPIILYNGAASINDTTNATLAAGYFPADSTIIAFNTIVNCLGGAGIVMGFRDGTSLPFEPLGIVVANNVIRMSSGQAILLPTGNNSLTYFAEGNLFNAPNGIGLSNAIGFTSSNLNYVTRINGLLNPPTIVTDAALNSNAYSSLLAGYDALQQVRTNVYDVGCTELNTSSNAVSFPLDSTLVGAGKPFNVLPVNIKVLQVINQDNVNWLQWQVGNEVNVQAYQVEYSINGKDFLYSHHVQATQSSIYKTSLKSIKVSSFFVRLRVLDKDGSFTLSSVVQVKSTNSSFKIYPNPAQTHFFIQTSPVFAQPTEAILFSLDGKQLMQQTLRNTVQKISVEQLAKGTYLLQIHQGKTILHQTLITVQ